ncbi:30S ribosomal protein S14 [Candidatus Roizmanbacteria bacterium CG2_30_33_16]|uniref:Small ribosomal subunit protein uS14 n=5 Tax=Candidatus Roizmaniibacteriota TaxID=1752723 RepID=A0A2M7E5N0_9BACT|nr:MAG: 30S ribosomal protein S14 [Candidatus Roizmanbacteria bacterium CG2_30_33_16]PIP64578.1 MAG: type Z 30S ribosomal protein S14 [Candidatus Roizmanbacteria bacterium CG22_combo_CG10-13_8_21_14_all_33_16]PIV63036.1 MAG: type Z 30S ribosomal protein S14 [Candidatus Roizmanbacteria bacterium CG01_land_8_20_14_3_00_33_9]PIX72317.1 MAG: type Z 30S ribosomal protein S14 [Candidatus Roizmanbacteria bacterium CG_4_10_14_3_um_filter_33_21]PJB88659.1 MAG: type Z 30S ribosomal protein S14 [Candidatu
MAKTSNVVRSQKKQKYQVRKHSRCPLCGRARAYMRRFDLCRICFREKALTGQIPGVRKISW